VLKHSLWDIQVSQSRRISATVTDRADRVIGSLASDLIDADSVMLLADVMARLKAFEQRKYLNAVITFVVKQYFPLDMSQHDDTPVAASRTVSGVANLIQILVKDSEGLRDHLISILARSTIPSLDDSLDARRSVIAALSQDEG
jgi:telomere length regulation protein